MCSFSFDKDYVLSDNVQQGLYGELYLLDKLIYIKRAKKLLKCWTGCNSETHDFYCGIDAVEVSLKKQEARVDADLFVTDDMLRATVEGAGFKVTGIE